MRQNVALCGNGLKNTLWEKENMLLTSSFSISRSVFCPSQSKFQFFSHYLFCHLPKVLYLSKILLFGEEITLPDNNNFGLDEIEGNSRKSTG